MIELIYGAKGSGKTVRIINKANDTVEIAKGNVVFLTAEDKYSLDIKNSVRFVVTKEYGIATSSELSAFIKGMIAGNTDISDFFIDGIARIGDVDPVQFVHVLDELGTAYKVNFTLTLSMATVPDELKRYL